MNEPLLVIAGPTGSGKNHIALNLAQTVSCEIINADSRQFYKGLTIGTNQPFPEEKQIVPHHLYGFLDPSQLFSASEYEKIAVLLIEQIRERGKLPVVVGGTGFYIKALLKGTWQAPPKNASLRSRLKKISQRHQNSFLYSLLKRLDSLSAEKISQTDEYRVIRALEIILTSGKKPSQLREDRPDRFRAIKYYLDLPRPALLENIRQRTEKMFQNGWIEEVSSLTKHYPDFGSMAASASIGYQEIIKYLGGEIDLISCKQRIIQRTSQYAKRQLTWFRNQDRFTRMDPSTDLHKLIESVLQLIS